MKWLIVFLLLGLVLLGTTMLWKELHTPAGSEGWVRVELPRGASLQRAAALLADRGLLAHPRAFVLWARVTGNAKRLQAGAYLLSPTMTPLEILERIVSGQIITLSFTIPEGSTMREIASTILRETGIDSAGFLSHCENDSFIRSLGVHASTLEGYLFPDTYTISSRAQPDRVAAMMVARLRGLLEQLEWDEELTGMTLHQILTLAAIVEKETRLPEERPQVAAVYLNRLRIGMKLDADPTVLYSMGGDRKRLTYEDLRFPSPYNTYLHAGLPPGPICSPGLGCIRAVLHPARDCDALFFVAKGDGSHVFSRTFSAHNRAVRRYRNSRRAGRKGG